MWYPSGGIPFKFELNISSLRANEGSKKPLNFTHISWTEFEVQGQQQHIKWTLCLACGAFGCTYVAYMHVQATFWSQFIKKKFFSKDS